MILRNIKILAALCYLCSGQLSASNIVSDSNIVNYIKTEESAENEANASLSPLFEISFGQKVNVIENFTSCIEKIEQNESGRGLLKRLCFLLKSIKALDTIFCFQYDGFIHITFEDGKGTCFSGKEYKPAKNINRFVSNLSQNMSVRLNIDLNNKSIVFNPQSGLGSIIPAIKLSRNNSFCEIGQCFDPLWITVAHELIHMEHFLTQELNKGIKLHIFGELKRGSISELKEQDINIINSKISKLNKFKGNDIDVFDKLPEKVLPNTLLDYYDFLNDPKRLHARYTKNLNIYDWKGLGEMVDDFPELKARSKNKGSLSFFTNLEERETVIGSRCSELTIRLAEEKNSNIILPMRYLYQDSDTFLLEETSVILEIINKARTNLEMPEITMANLHDKLMHANLVNFFNLGLFSHIVSEELIPDLLRKDYVIAKINFTIKNSNKIKDNENVFKKYITEGQKFGITDDQSQHFINEFNKMKQNLEQKQADVKQITSVGTDK